MKKLQTFKIRKHIVISAVLVLSIVFVNIWFYRSFEHQTLEVNEYIKEETITKISDYYNQVNSFTEIVFATEDFEKAKNLSDADSVFRSQNAIELVKKLNTVEKSMSMLETVYIYLKEPNLILCKSGILEPSLFYEIRGKDYFKTFEECQKAISNENKGKNFITGEDAIVFTFAFDGTTVLGAITYKEKVFPKTPHVEWINKANIYVYDRYNKLSLYNENMEISGLSEAPSYDKLYGIKDKYDVYSYDVMVSDMSYNVNVVFEKSQDMRMVKSVQGILNAMMAIFMLVLVYFLYNMYTTKIKPIEEISDLLGIDIEKIDYRLLKKPIKSIADKNALLNSMLEDKDTRLKTTILNGVLKGDINDDILQSENFGITFKFSEFVVVVINICRNDKLTEEENKELIKTFEDAITEMASNENGVPYFVSRRQYLVCIYNTDDNLDLEQLGSKFAYLAKILEIDFEFVASIAISNIHKGYWQVPIAYSEALEVINKFGVFDKSKVAFYKDVVNKSNNLKFDINDEIKLTRAIKNGNKTVAERIIRSVMGGIDSENTFTYTNISVGLIYSLMRIADSIFGENYDTSSISVLLKNTENKQALCDALIAFAEQMCDDRINLGEQGDLAEIIMDYIQKNYDNPQMSVEYISNNLNYSVVHVHNVFRKKYGKTIIQCLNDCRIEQAKKLIVEGMKIGEVANRVGISSIRTFNRLFQSITGMTPTKYREYGIKRKKGENEV